MSGRVGGTIRKPLGDNPQGSLMSTGQSRLQFASRPERESRGPECSELPTADCANGPGFPEAMAARQRAQRVDVAHRLRLLGAHPDGDNV
jgi:hypothetical protein